MWLDYQPLSGGAPLYQIRQAAATVTSATPPPETLAPVVNVPSVPGYGTLAKSPASAQGAVEFPYTIPPPHFTNAVSWFTGGSILNRGSPRWSNDADEYLRSALVDSNFPSVKLWADWYRQSYPTQSDYSRLINRNLSADKYTVTDTGKIYLPFSVADLNQFIEHVSTYHTKGFRQGPPRRGGNQSNISSLMISGRYRSMLLGIQAAAKTPTAQRLTRTTPYAPVYLSYLPDEGKHTASKIMVAVGGAIIGGAAIKALATGITAAGTGAATGGATGGGIASGATGAASGGIGAGAVTPITTAASAVSGAVKAGAATLASIGGSGALSTVKSLATRTIKAVAPTVTKLAEDYAAQQIQQRIVNAATAGDRERLERMLQDLQRQELELRAQVGASPSGIVYAPRQPGEPTFAQAEAATARAKQWNEAIKYGAIALVALAAAGGF